MSAPYALAVPRNGSLRHIIIDQPANRIPGAGQLSRSRALCGVRGATGWGGGAMRIVATPIAEADCRKCKWAAAGTRSTEPEL